MGTLRARLDYTYNDEYFATAQNLLVTPSYDVVNGFIGYTTGSGQWEFALQARNLLDDNYSVSTQGAFNSVGIFKSIPGTPREFVFRVKYMFGEKT